MDRARPDRIRLRRSRRSHARVRASPVVRSSRTPSAFQALRSRAVRLQPRAALPVRRTTARAGAIAEHQSSDRRDRLASKRLPEPISRPAARRSLDRAVLQAVWLQPIVVRRRAAPGPQSPFEETTSQRAPVRTQHRTSSREPHPSSLRTPDRNAAVAAASADREGAATKPVALRITRPDRSATLELARQAFQSHPRAREAPINIDR